MLKKIIIFSVGFIISLSFWLTLSSWENRIGDEEKIWGIFQGDMPTYLANARSTSERTFHLTYSSPYDLKQDKDDYLIQLPISLLSLLIKSGFSDSQANMIITLFFGTLMFAAIYILIECILTQFWMKITLYIILCLGGGLAWMSSLADGSVEFWSGIRFYERNYYWWFFNIFRNLIYPFELIHHSIFIFHLISLIRRKWSLANILLIMALFINPFLALHMILVHFSCVLLDRASSWKLKVYSVPAVLIWAVYYKFFLPQSSVFQSLIEQHSKAFMSSMELKDFLQAYGFSIVSLLFFLDKKFVRWIKEKWSLVPVIVLALITILLLENSRLPFSSGLQPLHFGRGYLYLSLWILTFSWLEFSFSLNRLNKRFVVFICVFFLLCSLPDNISFIRDMYLNQPAKPLLVWNSEREKVFTFLSGVKEPKHILVFEQELNRQLSAKFDHQVFFGTEYTTPDFERRLLSVKHFIQSRGNEKSDPLLKDWGVDFVILPKFQNLSQVLDPKVWEAKWESSEWIIYSKK